MSEQYVLAKPVFGYEVDDGDGLLIPMLEDTWYGEDKSLFVPLSVREQQIRDILSTLLGKCGMECGWTDDDFDMAVAAILGIEGDTKDE